MELPKNITQIGEANHRCKIYVEDYVISYMKQLNQVAQDKDMAVALYGVRKEENEVSYLFLYGACKLTFLQRETRHLSQAQQQEIDRCRERYFPEYSFLGYRLLNGEMIEGFHVCEQGICRYITGYAQFYEKNDCMLAYMLEAREEVQPEIVDQQKYEAVRRKQEERRTQHEENKYQKAPPSGSSNSSAGLRGMRVAVVAVFALLCMIGLTSMNGSGKMEDLQAMARQVIDGAMEQRIPDAEIATSEQTSADTLIAEDKLAEAVLQENEAEPSMSTENVVASEVTPESEMTNETIEISETAESSGITETVENTDSLEAPENTQAVEVTPEPEGETVLQETISEQAAEPVSYVIKEGDTLIDISEQNYGSDAKVSAICSLNQIEDPDDIKVGQKILLP